MNEVLENNLAVIVERTREEEGALLVLLAQRDGAIVACAGSLDDLPAAAQEYLRGNGLRRTLLALDDQDPEYAPSPGEAGGIRLHLCTERSLLLALAAPQTASAETLARAASETWGRIHSALEAERQLHRRQFLGRRLIQRHCDRPVMSAEVRQLLERLCDGVLDLEEAIEQDADCTQIIHDFRETLDELIEWPKRSGSSFQQSLETFRESIDDIRPDDVCEDHLHAMVGGLEMAIQSWPLP